jgi:TM2 domain-containing membrane protein YozV
MASREQIGRKCPYCGAMFTYDEYFCRACHRKFTDQNELDAPSSHRPDTYTVALPKLWVSAVLSCIGPGLGQFYNGDSVKGTFFFLGFLFISFGYIVTPYHTILVYGIWIISMIEALYTARRISRCERSYAGPSLALYGELALFGLVAVLFALTGEPDLQYMAKLFPAIGLWMGYG